MKILLITQKVDINDDILGFMHGWIKKLAEKLKSLDVICLYKGKYDLPKNVKVYSLGKEKNGNKLKYLWRLYKYAWKLLKKNDLLFVHMNHKYIILLWPLVKIFRKPIVLWKTRRGSISSLKIAIRLCNKVFTASKLSLDYTGNKKEVLGHGINTDLFSFKPYSRNRIKTIVLVGRITSIKKQHLLIKIVHCLINELGFKDVRFKIVGSPKTQKDVLYFEKIKGRIEKSGFSDYFSFQDKVLNKNMPLIYYKSEALIDLAKDAGLDKAPLEAMSCGRIIFASQPALQEILGDYKEELSINLDNSKETAGKIKKYLNLNKEDKEKIGRSFREIIVRNHNLDNLSNRLIKLFKKIIS